MRKLFVGMIVAAVCGSAMAADDGVIRPTVESLSASVQTLQAENAKLKAENTKLKSEVARLEKLVPSTKPALEPIKKKEIVYGHSLKVDQTGVMPDSDNIKIKEILNPNEAVCQWVSGTVDRPVNLAVVVVRGFDFSKNADGDFIGSKLATIKVVETKKIGSTTYMVIEPVK